MVRVSVMSSLRSHARINRSADDVWKVVSDAAGISAWFPGIAEARVDGENRIITIAPGVELVERIVTNDAALRRFQYSITGGPMPVESHLGTVDVIEDGDAAFVVYSTEVTPDTLAAVMGPSIEAGVAGLKAFCEG